MRSPAQLCVLAPLVAAACVSVPEPPPPAEDLSGLAQRYENPTAELPEADVRDFIARALEYDVVAQILNGLKFVRSGVDDASRGLEKETAAEELEVQGRVRARVPCPGDEPTPHFDRPESGAVAVTFGVEDSELLRGFEGSVDVCRFRVDLLIGEPQQVWLSGKITGDLGKNLRIGDPLPSSLLAKLGGVTGQSVGATRTIDLGRDSYHFRLTEDDALETLLDSAELGLGDYGSVVLVIQANASAGLRERRGTWTCVGTSACTLAR